MRPALSASFGRTVCGRALAPVLAPANQVPGSAAFRGNKDNLHMPEMGVSQPAEEVKKGKRRKGVTIKPLRQ